MKEKKDQIQSIGRLFDFHFDETICSMLDNLVKSGMYDTEKDVIIQAIKNLHERTKAREKGSVVIETPIGYSSIMKSGFDFEKQKKEWWIENKKRCSSPKQIAVPREFIEPVLTDIEMEQDVKLITNDEKLSTQRQLYGNESIGIVRQFHNRILPVKLALMVLVEKINTEKNGWIELENLKKGFSTYTQQFKFLVENTLDDIENNGIDRYTVLTFPEQSHKVEDDWKFERKQGRFAHYFVGKLVKKKENKFYDTSDEHYLTGALFEMGLIKAKRVVKKRWGRTMTGKSYKNIKNIIYVSPTKLGLDFLGLKNPLIDFFSRTDLDKDGQISNYVFESRGIFSKEEQDFYIEKILPKFEFEYNFVKEMVSIGRFERSEEIKELFDRKYFEWMKLNYPQDYQELTKDDEKRRSFVRMRSLSIMARLVELGIFVKEPGSKFGPYYLREK
tara:strand:+ start:13 stop:1347 length:1335 start_codon:yes stop_codon:yes gene_type:complete